MKLNFVKENRELTASVEKLNADLVISNKTITELTEKVKQLEASKTDVIAKPDYDKMIAEKDEAISLLSTQLAETNKNLEDFESKVEKTASAKALEICASGSAPVAIQPTANPASLSSTLLDGYNTLSNDPAKQRKYWEQNEKALRALIYKQ